MREPELGDIVVIYGHPEHHLIIGENAFGCLSLLVLPEQGRQSGRIRLVPKERVRLRTNLPLLPCDRVSA